MKLHTKLTLGLMSSLLAASIATATEYTPEMNPNKSAMNSNSMGTMSGDMKKDPVATTTRHLTELKDKLNLTPEQQPAWQTFSTQINDQAKKMAAMRDEMKSGAQAWTACQSVREKAASSVSSAAPMAPAAAVSARPLRCGRAPSAQTATIKDAARIEG